MRGRSVVQLAAVSVAALVCTACLSEGGDSGGGGGGGAGEADGSVEIFGAFGGAEQEAFEASIADFEAESGIDIQYNASQDFTTLIRSRVQGNNAPDIAIFPQPGLLGDLADSGDLAALDDAIDLPSVEETLVPGLTEATVGEDGSTYGVPIRMAVKSVLWSPAPEFEQAGYAAPTTNDELLALTDQIRGTGTSPWCIGAESDQATGWVITDWLEEYVLRVAGEDFYNQWARHEVPFNSPEVIEAGRLFEQIAFTEGNVLGGRQSITSNSFGTAANPMFETPPQCFLHRQGNFITSGDFFPAEVTANLDQEVTVNPFPPVNEADGQATLLGGDWATLFNAENADAVRVLEFLASDQFGGPWAQAGGWLSPHTSFDASQYPDETTRQIFTFATEAEVTGVDGSDQMPGEVGSGSFWRGAVAWVTGQQDLETVLNEIEASWPAS